MPESMHDHDLTDHQWSLLEPHLPGREGAWGGVARDNRRFFNAVMWILHNGVRWRALPPVYGHWRNVHRRFRRWCKKGIWSSLFQKFIHSPDFEWLMIDSTHCKVHQHATGAQGGNQAIGCTKGGNNTKIHLAVDAHGMPVRVIVTSGTEADCTHACELIAGIEAEHLLADKGYDSEQVIQQAQAQGMQVQIPPRKNRKVQREYDKHLYRLRHLVENTFQQLKQWRGIATRYAKKVSSFTAAVNIRCLHMWLKIS